MRTKDFSEFIAIWKLADIDGGCATLSFQNLQDGRLHCSFEGLHVGAIRTSADVQIEGLSELIAIPWKTLAGALALLDDESPLTARLTDTNLLLHCGARRVNVRISSEKAPYSYDVAQQDQASIDLSSLPSFVSLLSVIAAKTIENPVLTGINISTAGKNSLLLRATDRLRAFAATLNSTTNDPPMETTIQAADLITCFDILQNQVGMYVDDRNALILRDDRTLIRVSTLFGEYPSFAPLPRSGFAHEFVLPAEIIRLAHRAAMLIDSERLVTIEAAAGKMRVRVNGSEVGDFEVEVDDGPDDAFEATFDAEKLIVAADLGAQVTVHIVDKMTPAYFSGEKGMFYWLSQTFR